MNKKTIRDIDVSNKRVLVRCDYNVPLDKDGNITDNRRIVQSLNTIKYLELDKKQQEECKFYGLMYIWMFRNKRHNILW